MNHSSGAFFREDPATQELVLFAPRRSARPDEARAKDDDACHLCPIVISPHTWLASDGSGDHQIIATWNAFPALSSDTDAAYGKQELLIEGASHESFLTWSDHELARLFRFYGKRMKAAKEYPRIRYVIVFKNAGRDAGASQPHPHSQLYAMEKVSPRLLREAEIRTQNRAHHHSCASCLAVRHASGGTLVIYEDEFAIAFAHPQGRFAYETRLLSKRHADNLSQLTSKEETSLARAYRACLPLLEEKNIPYNLYAEELVDDPDEHAEIRLAPRLSRWGGLEISSGVFVNPVLPEDAAREYRETSERVFLFPSLRRRG